MTDYLIILETAKIAVSSIENEKLREIAFGSILNHLLWADKSESNIEKQRAGTFRNVTWVLILILLACIAFGFPLWMFLHKDELQTSFLLAIAAFSIAFALHFSDVSATICGIYIREQGDRRYKIRDIESRIVWSAHFAIAGGVVILASYAMFILKVSYFLPEVVYLFGAILLSFGVAKYFKRERGWPWDIIKVLNAKPLPNKANSADARSRAAD